MLVKRRFSGDDVEVLAKEELYKGFFSMLGYRLRYRLFAGGWGPPIHRELFQRRLAVGVLPFDPEHNLVGLVEQFRIGAIHVDQSPWLLEVAAGIVEEGEQPEDVARRELLEETGVLAERLVPICDCLLSPGGSDERMVLYCALADLEGKEGIYGLAAEAEDIYFHVLDAALVLAGLKEGLCDNAPLIIALQWLALHYDDIVKAPSRHPL